MNHLIAQLQRLYFPDSQEGVPTPDSVRGSLAGDASVALDPLGSGGAVRTMAVSFERAGDWEQVSKLFRGVQEDLDLPAPAISVSARAGYRVWFSLAAPVPVEQARTFLNALHLKYLADIPLSKLHFHPDIGDSAAEERSLLELVPALNPETGRWPAFIDPSMGSMFIDEPGLEMAPNLEKQASLLAGFESIKAGDFERVLTALQPDADLSGHPGDYATNERSQDSGHKRSQLSVGSNFSDPKSFLLAVMNDPSASAKQRIKAAKALLPYFEGSLPK